MGKYRVTTEGGTYEVTTDEPEGRPATSGSMALDFMQGGGAELISTALGAYNLLRKIPGADKVLPAVSPEVQQYAEPPHTVAAKLGGIFTTLGEFAVPGGAAADITKGAGLLARSGAQALAAGGVEAAHSGGDVSKTIDTAALGAAGPVVGAAAKAAWPFVRNAPGATFDAARFLLHPTPASALRIGQRIVGAAGQTAEEAAPAAVDPLLDKIAQGYGVKDFSSLRAEDQDMVRGLAARMTSNAAPASAAPRGPYVPRPPEYYGVKPAQTPPPVESPAAPPEAAPAAPAPETPPPAAGSPAALPEPAPKPMVMYHGSPKADLTELQPGSMMSNEPGWPAGYTTKINPDMTEDFTGKIYASRPQYQNPVYANTLHGAEGKLLELAEKSGQPYKSLKDAANIVNDKYGIDAIVARNAEGQITGIIPLKATPVEQALDPVQTLRSYNGPIASNIQAAMERAAPPAAPPAPAEAPATTKPQEVSPSKTPADIAKARFAQAKADRFVKAIQSYNERFNAEPITSDAISGLDDAGKSVLTRALKSNGLLNNTETFTDTSFPYIVTKLRQSEYTR